MKKQKILFLYPALLSGFGSYRANGNSESSYIDYGFAMLSAVCKREGHECFSMVLNSFQSWQHFEDVLKQQTFDLALITFLSANEKHARQMVEVCKRTFPEKYIIGGGVYLSVTNTREYANIDVIVKGEGEPHILGIVDDIANGKPPKKVYELEMVKDLNTLPYVDRNLFNRDFEESSPLVAGLPAPMITMVAGRGCYGKCTFCFPTRNKINGDKIRIRSVDNFIGEILEINQERTVGSIMIHDDLLGTKKWVKEFIAKWKASGLPRIPMWCQMRADVILRIKEFIPELSNIGLSYISIGLESGSNKQLEFLKKGTTVEQNIEACLLLQANHINIFGNYILALPLSTEEDLRATERMLEIIKPQYLATSIYTSYEGSALYDWVAENNMWVEPEEHYSMVRHPYERKIKGVDYDKLFNVTIPDHQARFQGELLTYKEKPSDFSPVIDITGGKAEVVEEVVVEEPVIELPVVDVDFAEQKTIETPKLPTIDSSEGLVNEEKAIEEERSYDEELKRQPLVSCIIISYNRPKMLKRAIQSILDQTYTNWEIIINDYTEDWNVNKELYDKYKKDKRFTWLRHKVNINNISFCWNEALDIIKGEYWFTLDDDNTKYPKFIEVLLDLLEQNPNKTTVVCAMQHEGTLSGSGIHYKRPQNFEEQQKSNHIDSGQVLHRRVLLEKIGNFDEKLVALDDWEYMIRIFALNNKTGSAFGWKSDDEPLCSYFWHKDKRMYDDEIYKASISLGSELVKQEIRNDYKVRFYSANKNLTESQIQLTDNIIKATTSLECITVDEEKPDFIFLMGTLYNMEVEDVKKLKVKNPNSKLVALLMEEPQAFTVNLKYLEHVDYVFANDLNSQLHYLSHPSMQRIRTNIFHYNCLLISNNLLSFIEDWKSEKTIDVCLVGYAYPSRVELIKQLREKFDGSIVVIGDEWSKQGIKGIQVFDTLNEIETYKISSSAKINIIKHRDDKDVGGFPEIKPLSVHRGYIEACYRSVLMIDSSRENNCFENNGAVISYTDADNLNDNINKVLKNYKKYSDDIDSLYEMAITKFTHRNNMMKVVNCIRSSRFSRSI